MLHFDVTAEPGMELAAATSVVSPTQRLSLLIRPSPDPGRNDEAASFGELSFLPF